MVISYGIDCGDIGGKCLYSQMEASMGWRMICSAIRHTCGHVTVVIIMGVIRVVVDSDGPTWVIFGLGLHAIKLGFPGRVSEERMALVGAILPWLRNNRACNGLRCLPLFATHWSSGQ
jgi:hypothetical protein